MQTIIVMTGTNHGSGSIYWFADIEAVASPYFYSYPYLVLISQYPRLANPSLYGRVMLL